MAGSAQGVGNWNTVHRRFRRWAQSGVFQRIFDVILEDLDRKAVMVDGTFAKVHRHGAGAKKSGCPPDESADRQAIGRSRGGLTTKLMAMVDKTGRLVRFTIRPGNAAEALSCPLSSTASPQANSSLTKPTIPTPSGSRSPRMELSQPFPRGSTAGSSIGTTRSGTGPATLSRTTSATSSSFEPSPPGTTSWRTATAPWLTWPPGSSRPGERRKSQSISKATNSPPTTLNYPWPWPWWPEL